MLCFYTVRVSRLWFYRRCIRHAAQRAWHTADTLSTLFGLFAPLALWYSPGWEAQMSEILWLAPLCALATVFLTRVFLAPYELYQERDTEAKKTEAQLRQQIAALMTQLDDRMRKREIRVTLGQFIREGNQLCARYQATTPEPKEAAEQWVEEIHRYLRKHLDDSYVDRLENRIGIAPTYQMNTNIPPANTRLYQEVSFRLTHLKEFLHELS
jgi:hypothetical protein